MGTRKKQTDLTKLKPGSSVTDAKKVSGEGDFGAPADDVNARTYTSENTRRSDPGGAQISSSEEHRGERTAGVSSNDAGPGSGSGGDIDTSFVGVAGGSGLADDIIKEHQDGLDDSVGTSAEFASGGPARGENQTHVGKVGGGKRVTGRTRQLYPQESDTDDQGADVASRDDGLPGDAFQGEVSADEASGRNDEP